MGHGFSKVIVWGGQAMLDRIEDRPWLVKSHETLLDRRLPYCIFSQRFMFSSLARTAGYDVLYVPASTYAGGVHPMVIFSQKLPPFEWHELRRFAGRGWRSNL